MSVISPGLGGRTSFPPTATTFRRVAKWRAIATTATGKARKGNNTTRNKSIIAAFGSGALLAALAAPMAHGTPGTNLKIVVGGEDITQNIVQFAASRSAGFGAACLLTDGSGNLKADINNTVGLKNGVVSFVGLTDEIPPPGGHQWGYNPEPPRPAPGDATLTKTGDVYQVTGHVTAFQYGAQPNGGLVPFEFDITCG